jgi:iron(II)-dependent oxidoreductase
VTPKDARDALPPADALVSELDRVHARAEEALLAGRVPEAPQAKQCGLPIEFLPAHLVQHELQHAEHVRTISALLQGSPVAAPAAPLSGPERISFAGGEARIGAVDAAEAYDNERPPHTVRLGPFWIARGLVTVAEYADFARSTGARPPRFAGTPEAPVCGISWVEADAYARFRGARLPTEFEWEHAAPHLGGATGSVWQWTASWFEPYPGFQPYPYEGYSVPWFGGTHRVLRGGSFATHPSIGRYTFRNWYEPGFRELFAGLRLAGDLR